MSVFFIRHLLLTLLPSPARVALTHEVVVKRFDTRGASEEAILITGRNHVTRARVSPGAASIAVAKLEAAALGVRPQGLNEGTQYILNVVSEKYALML